MPLLHSAPLGLRWRSSYWFVTFIAAASIATDYLVYSLILPVLPFHLEKLGYTGVSALMGWLLFSYSAGLVLSTIPITWFSEKYQNRRTPLIFGLLILIGAQVMLMELPRFFWVLCIARILQGIAATFVWVLTLALLCESSPPQHTGRQLGFAMSGMTVGLLLGPATGGAIYTRFGYRGVFVLGMSACVFDLIGRLLIVERKTALKYNYDPWSFADSDEAATNEGTTAPSEGIESEKAKNGEGSHAGQPGKSEASAPTATETPQDDGPEISLSLPAVLLRLLKSPRAVVSFVVSIVIGIIMTGQEAVMPLHLNRVWGLEPAQVGLVFLASVVPTLFSAPLAGFLADKIGEGLVTTVAVILAVPWVILQLIEGPMALFVACFALQNFFTAALLAPITSELAAVARGMPGVGFGHVYGVFNIMFGVGSAVGPIIGGQLHEHLRRGWMILILILAGLLCLLLVPLIFVWLGEEPALAQLKRLIRGKRDDIETIQGGA